VSSEEKQQIIFPEKIRMNNKFFQISEKPMKKYQTDSLAQAIPIKLEGCTNSIDDFKITKKSSMLNVHDYIMEMKH
jgi:hypothetical protein